MALLTGQPEMTGNGIREGGIQQRVACSTQTLGHRNEDKASVHGFARSAMALILFL